MLCSVYKSAKKAQTYLFINKRDDFSDVPEALMNVFGTPILVSVINLATKTKLGFAELDKVKEGLTEQGYYLQLTPKEEDMLKAHKAEMLKAKAKTKEQQSNNELDNDNDKE